MESSAEINLFALALSKAQGEFTDSERDRDNPFFDSSYSTMAAVLGACRKALAANEISVLQSTEHAEGNKIAVTTMLIHSSGQWFKTVLAVSVVPQIIDKNTKEKAITPQAIGSASTYACRYALRSLLVIATEDDDGNEGSGKVEAKNAAGCYLDVILEVNSETKNGKGGKPFTIHRIETGEHGTLSTFDFALADLARSHSGQGEQVEITAEKNAKGFGFDLVSISLLSSTQENKNPPPSNAPRADAKPGFSAEAIVAETAADLLKLTTLDQVAMYKEKAKAKGGPWFSEHIKEMIRVKYQSLVPLKPEKFPLTGVAASAAP